MRTLVCSATSLPAAAAVCTLPFPVDTQSQILRSPFGPLLKIVLVREVLKQVHAVLFGLDARPSLQSKPKETTLMNEE